MASQQPQGAIVPKIQLHSPAVDFIENHLAKNDEAFNYPYAKFDPKRDRFIDDTLPLTHVIQPPRPQTPQVESMRFWTDILPSAMSRLSEIPEPEGRSKSGYSIRNLLDWIHVKEKLELARECYEFESKGNDASPGIRNRARKVVRKMVDRSVVPLQQAAQFVPDVDIASPIVGAVKVLLAAYRNAAEVRGEISTGFDDMGDGFATIDFYVTVFPNDQNIIKAAEKVVLAVLKAVEQAIGFFTSHQITRAGSAVLKGTEYQRELRDRLCEVKNCINELDIQGERSHKYQNDLANQQNQEEHKITQNFLRLDVRNQFYFFLKISEQLHDIKRQNEVIISFQSRSCSPQPVLPQIETLDEVWEALQIPDIDHIDLNYITKKAGSLPFEDRGRAEQVVDTRQFKQWMLSDKHWIYSGNQWVRLSQNNDVSGRTMKLLVHGDYDSNDNISPFSVLCASLMGILRSQKNFISLVFFCGRHLDGDESPGSLAMIRSLVGQLLQQSPSYPSGLAQHVSMQDVRGGDVQELCKLFGCLIRQLPSTVTVFCVIDGIGFYEREQYKDDMEEILVFILSLAEDEEQGVDTAIKLFLTSPQPTRYVRAVFQEGVSLLNMAAVPDVAQGPSSVRFNRQISNVI
ncbi:hypothetical protein GL218_07411 [Daldinia childiae]|uniref:uncharacterized protein n=1 Tax=Daldinia childiae TaxID=326645 RepID=UPI001445B5C2|nr:uncharacterized protein GL218_07411 [Daldinia childiae]KAF3054786.1 hypothetical protein GL218_07411 [Daldinia childiae]